MLPIAQNSVVGWVNNIFSSNHVELNEQTQLILNQNGLENIHLSDENRLEQLRDVLDLSLAQNINNSGLKEVLTKVDHQCNQYFAIKDAASKTSTKYRDVGNYQIQDEMHLFSLAKEAAHCYAMPLNKILEMYQISDSEQKYEIYKIVAAGSNFCASIAQMIQELQILEEDKRIELAKIEAESKNSRISRYIQNFEITDEKALVEIAKIEAEHHPSFFYDDCKNFGITDENTLIEILKIAVSKSSFRIDHLPINDQNTLVELARHAAEHESAGFSYKLAGFRITDPSILVEIAKTVASSKNTEFTRGFIEHFGNYGIEDYETRLEIAKLIANNGDPNLASHIATFDLNEEDLLDIATRLTTNGCNEFCKHIQSFNISNEEDRRKLAMLAAEAGLSSLPEYIDEFEITDEQTLIKLAKTIALNNSTSLSKYVQSFRINDEETRFELAAIAAKNGSELAYMENYEISSPELITQIVKIYLTRSNAGIAQILKSIGALNDFWKEALKIDKNISNFLVDLKKIPSVHETEYLQWVKDLIYYYETNPLFKERFEEVIQFFDVLGEYRDPVLRSKITRFFLCTFFDEDTSGKLDSFIEELGRTKGRKERKKLIPMMLLYSMVDRKTSDQYLDNLFYKDAHYLSKLNNGLFTLANSDEEEVGDKRRILEFFLKGGKKKQVQSLINTNILVLDTIIKLGYGSKLKECKSIEGFAAILDEIFENEFRISMPDLKKKYDATFGKFRNNAIIFTYLASLKGLGAHDREKAIQALTFYVLGVLEGTFHANRYDIQQNIHLNTVFAGREELFEEWKKGCTLKEKDLEPLFKKGVTLPPKKLKDLQIVDTDDPEDLIACGTEVNDSCQAVNGSPINNKGLLGYLLNGQTRLIAVKDQNGKLIGRCLLRILIDKKTNKPVLYREQFYINSEEDRMKALLNAMCRERAANLGLPLYASGERRKSIKLVSLGGAAPFEYVDAVSRVASNSEYSFDV